MKHTLLAEQRQPGNEERSVGTLNEALAALERSLNGKANMLDRKRCSTNNYTHWKARGSQGALRLVAKHLRGMRHEHRSLRALHSALSGYLLCLEKSSGDAQEDTTLPAPRRGIPVVQWKAEGECLVLPDICTAITDLLEAYAPGKKTPKSGIVSLHSTMRQGRGLNLLMETLLPSDGQVGEGLERGTANELLAD